MPNTYTAVYKKSGAWFIGWIEEVPGVNCQERTYDALMESLREALAEALSINRANALAAADSDFQEKAITL